METQMQGALDCLVLSQKTGRLMLHERLVSGTEAAMWSMSSRDTVADGVSLQRAAFDCLFEQTGYEGTLALVPLALIPDQNGMLPRQVMLAIVADEYEPWQSTGHGAGKWFSLGDWPEPLHPDMDHVLGDFNAMQVVTSRVRDITAGRDFIAGAEPPERTLYHCLYREPEGDFLLPTCVRSVNGRESPFLFAASYFSKALAFAFSYHGNKGIVCNGGLYGTPDEFAIICDRDEVFAAPMHARVFSFSSKNFESAWDMNSRQYVSTEAVAFQNAKLVYEARSLEDLMRGGLQIFSTSKTRAEVMPRLFGDMQSVPSGSCREWLANVVRSEGLTWENQARAVNPNALVATLLDQPATDLVLRGDCRSRQSTLSL